MPDTKFDLKPPLMGATAGAAAYFGVRFLQPKIITGAGSNLNNPVETRNQGREYLISGGALAYDTRFDDWADANRGFLRDDLGRRVPIGGAAAAFVAYDLTVRYAELSNRWGRILERSLRPEVRDRMLQGFARNGKFSVEGLDDREVGALVQYVDAVLKGATCFRILSRCYRAAGMKPHTFPSRHAGDHDLRVLHVRGVFNPMVAANDGQPFGYQIGDAIDWEAWGILVIQKTMEIYPGVTRDIMNERSTVALAQSVSAFTDHSYESTAGMGVLPALVVAALEFLGVLITIAMPLVRLGVGVWLGEKAINAVAEFFGVNHEYSSMLADEYSEAAEECRAGNDRACAQMGQLSQDAAAYRSSVGLGNPWVLVIVGVPLAGGAIWMGRRWWKKHRSRSGSRALSTTRRERKLLT